MFHVAHNRYFTKFKVRQYVLETDSPNLMLAKGFCYTALPLQGVMHNLPTLPLQTAFLRTWTVGRMFLLLICKHPSPNRCMHWGTCCSWCIEQQQQYTNQRCYKRTLTRFLLTDIIWPPTGPIWSFSVQNRDCFFFKSGMCIVQYTLLALQQESSEVN